MTGYFTVSLSHSYPLVRIGIIYCMYPWFISPFFYYSVSTFSWDVGTVTTSFNRSRYTTLFNSTPQSYKRKGTDFVYLSLDVYHYLARRRAFTFPLDNLTKVSTDSFSKVYFFFGEGLVVLKGPRILW